MFLIVENMGTGCSSQEILQDPQEPEVRDG